MKHLREYDPITGSYNTVVWKKFSKWELDNITRNPKKLIAEIEILKGDLQKLDVKIVNSEMVNCILSNLPG